MLIPTMDDTMVILEDKYREKPYVFTGPLTASSTERVKFDTFVSKKCFESKKGEEDGKLLSLMLFSILMPISEGDKTPTRLLELISTNTGKALERIAANPTFTGCLVHSD